MDELKKYKEEKIENLQKRLIEIYDIVRLDVASEFSERTDSFARGVQEEQVENMKKYYEEMVSIKKEIAKLKGIESYFNSEQ